MTRERAPEEPLAAGRRRLIEQLLAEEGLDVDHGEEIRPRREVGRYPLSFAQERMFFLDRWSPGSPAYNIDAGFRLAGELAAVALAASLAEILRRHEVLRSRYRDQGGRPKQEIAPAGPVALPVVDLSRLDRDFAEEESRHLAGLWARQPFDLGRGPLVRAVLFRLAIEEHRLSLGMHHMVSDGWSLGVLLRELVAGYRLALGEAETVPSPPIQYADFAAWQRARLQGEALERLVEHWRERLAGAPAVLELPTDRSRPPERRYRGGIETAELPAELCDAMRRVGRERGATLFMSLLALVSALLSRLTGEQDICVGSPVANRTRAELEGLIGFFVNTLVLRTSTREDPGFGELVERAREVTLDAYDHQDLPFEKLVEELDVARDPSHSPLFQVMLILQNAPVPRVELPGLAMSPWNVPGETAKFDLAATFIERGSELLLAVDFNRDLFDRSTVRRLVRELGTLTESAIAQPDLPLSALSLLGSAERWQILGEWNDTTTTYPGARNLHRLIEERASGMPDSIALLFEGRAVSYGILVRRAARIAGQLCASGVGPESLVGVFCERSITLVEALLAILGAGGAYVPLDPEAPAARLATVIEDAGLAAILAQSHLAPRLPSGVPVVTADGPRSEPATSSEAPPAGPAAPAGAVYAIYTSGSTGRPKGVVNTHEALCNRILWMQDVLRLGEDDRVLQKTPYTFDVSVWEFFWPLVIGARMVLARPGLQGDPRYLADLIAREGVTTLHFVPSMLRAFLDEGAGTQLPSLRRVVASGEALPPELARRFFDRLDCDLYNLYGPTEAAIDVTCWRCAPDRDAQTVPIGRPIANLRTHVMDSSWRPSVLGVVGELALGGAGLARGYLGRPGMTAERFVPDPFAHEEGARLYRTGDLARHLADGAVAFVGRNDHQVKLRGFRIELGEIEAVLEEHPLIREAVVIHRDGPEGAGWLLAYFVASDETPAADDVRAFLRERLPDYMVPGRFIELDALPSTASGKVDRRDLREREVEPDGQAPYVPPRNEVEEVLAGIWSQVVGVDRVGVHDNYFALGGDSIRAIQVIARAKERGLELDLQQVFRHQTVAELARAVGFAGAAADLFERTEPFCLVSEEDRVELPEDVEDAYPLAVLQAGMLYHIDLTPEESVYHNINSVHLEIPFRSDLFRRAVDAVVRRHPILRTSFHLTGFSEPLQLVHREATLPIEVEDLRGVDGPEQDRAVAERIDLERGRPFDIGRPPLWRFFVQIRSDESFQLTMAENHAIFDGWSLHATLDELFNSYLALLGGEALREAPPPAVAYRDFVRLEREAVGSQEHRRFWAETLADPPLPQLPEPEGRAREESPAPRMHSESWVIPRSLADGLRRTAREAALPLKSVLLAAHCKVMSLLAGRPEVLTGLASNGRPEALDGEEVRGLFLNMVPFRLDLEAGSWIDLARRAFDTEVATLPYRVFPMGVLQQELGGRPLLETVFTYVHFHAVQDLVRGGDLRVRDFRLAEVTHFPLATTFRVSPLSETLSLVVVCDVTKLPLHLVAAARGYFDRVLQAIAETPDRHHESQCLVGEEERRLVLAEWCTGDGRPAPELLHAPVLEAARRAPEALAVVSESGGLTYGELRERSSRLAHWLLRRGAGPGERVAVRLERSEEMLVAILGILEAGAAYVPLDPRQPEERLAWMIRDSRPVLLLTVEALVGGVPDAPVPEVCLDRLREELGSQPAVAPEVTTRGDDLAYVLYTSGSTGRPKGVMVPHRGIANRCAWMQAAHSVGSGDRVLLKTPFVFDASVWEMFVPWMGGATVALAGPDGHKDASYLADSIGALGVSVLQLVPSMLRVFLDEPELGQRCRGLRRLFSGGEELTSDLVTATAERLPGVELVNLYGPTETAIDATSWPFPEPGGGRVPIGKPIDNVRTLVLDPFLQPVPPGVPGELLVGGRGLARGYLGRPGLTAERFVPDPFAGEAGVRLFRTGDGARWRIDGALEFQGRLDFQTKVRGFRIELGEIECALRSEPRVAEAVVVVRDDLTGGRELVAHVVPANGEPPDVEGLRSFLGRTLPDYMIPGLWVFLDELPRTPGGKLDRRALEKLEGDRLHLERAYVPPSSEVEKRLAEIWSAVLGVPQVGLHDDFFALGGHSLSVIQVISRVRKAFPAELTLKTLYARRTLAAVAEEIELSLASSGGGETPVPAVGEAPIAASAGSGTAAGVEVDRLSDEEVDSLLGDLLRNGGGV